MIHQAILLLFLLASASASAMGPAPSCPDITYQLGPCISYLLQIEVAPPPACCDGVKYLSRYSSDKEDREAICWCIKGAASMMGLTDFALISALPNTCGVSVKLPPISSDIDCSQTGSEDVEEGAKELGNV